MHLVQDHKLNLPYGFITYENRDTLRVDCAKCGHEAKYQARHVDTRLVEADAWGHLTACPGRPPLTGTDAG